MRSLLIENIIRNLGGVLIITLQLMSIVILTAITITVAVETARAILRGGKKDEKKGKENE